MRDLYTILNVKKNTGKEAVKQSYYKMLFALHPTNKQTGNPEAFIELQSAYKRHLSGESFQNCWAVVPSTFQNVKCRCGGEYTIIGLGRVDCEYCSCFIEVEEPLLDLPSYSLLDDG